MTEEEAKAIIREHLLSRTSNVRQLMIALEVATAALGDDATIDEVYLWAKDKT